MDLFPDMRLMYSGVTGISMMLGMFISRLLSFSACFWDTLYKNVNFQNCSEVKKYSIFLDCGCISCDGLFEYGLHIIILISRDPEPSTEDNFSKKIITNTNSLAYPDASLSKSSRDLEELHGALHIAWTRHWC